MKWCRPWSIYYIYCNLRLNKSCLLTVVAPTVIVHAQHVISCSRNLQSLVKKLAHDTSNHSVSTSSVSCYRHFSKMDRPYIFFSQRLVISGSSSLVTSLALVNLVLNLVQVSLLLIVLSSSFALVIKSLSTLVPSLADLNCWTCLLFNHIIVYIWVWWRRCF